MPSTPATAGVYSPIACHQRPPPRASIPPLHAINARHRGRLFHHCMPSTPATAGVYSPIACHQRPPPRASILLACHQRPPPRASILLAKSITSAAGRCLSPPRQIYHICRRQMSTPPRHLWRGGGRQAGGEVQTTNQAPPKTKKARHKGGLRNSIISFQWHLIRSKDKTMN